MTTSILLLIAFYLLLVGEFCLPTGGLLGVTAAAAVISSVAVAFSTSFTLGLVMLSIVLVSTPLMLTGLVRIWPHTPIGRRMLNRRPGQTDPPAAGKTTRSGSPLEALVGCRGIAKSNLLPGGLVAVEGHRVDAISNGLPIDCGEPVIVTRVRSGRIEVRPVLLQDDAVAQDSAGRGNDGTAAAPPSSPAALEQELDLLD